MSGPHICEDVIDRYVIGVLDEDAKAEVEEHILDCPACQEKLMEADRFLAMFRAAAVQPDARPAPFWTHLRSLGLRWAAVAGALGLLTAVIAPRHSGTGTGIVAVEMQSLRGPEAAMRISAGRQGLLKFDVTPQTAVENYRIQIVDTAGAEVLTSGAMISDNRLAARIGKLARGAYWVRVYLRRPAPELIAEYGLTAE